MSLKSRHHHLCTLLVSCCVIILRTIATITNYQCVYIHLVMCEVCNDDMQTDSYSLYIFGHIWHGMIDREIIGDRRWGGGGDV